MIAGRYEELGEGLARDTELDRVVRLRWLESRDEVDDPRLSHPNVVRVYDIGEHDGRRFAAVEHVEGLPLALLAPLDLRAAVDLGVGASRALAAAHALGLVHRGEIVVRGDGVPKLSGFRPGEPGDDVRALADALAEACPQLPTLTAATPVELQAQLERARPAPTLITRVLPPALAHRRRIGPLVLAGVAALAIGGGVVAALVSGDDDEPAQRATTVRVDPVPYAPTAEQQARNLAAWLSRWSR